MDSMRGFGFALLALWFVSFMGCEYDPPLQDVLYERLKHEWQVPAEATDD